MSFHQLGSALSVDFFIMILTSLARIFPPPSLQLDSQSLAWCLVVDLCIWFCQLLDEGFTNLIIEEGQFGLPLHYF